MVAHQRFGALHFHLSWDGHGQSHVHLNLISLGLQFTFFNCVTAELSFKRAPQLLITCQ